MTRRGSIRNTTHSTARHEGAQSPDVLPTLAKLFYGSLDELGQFEHVGPEMLSLAAQRLLWHDDLMTVALETYHACPLDVQVLDSIVSPEEYARSVLLTCRPRGTILQFGIVRVQLACLAPDVRRDVLAAKTPVGRALLTHEVRHEVQLLSLWRNRPGLALRRFLCWQVPEYLHFCWDGCYITGLTPIGRATIDALVLNHERRMKIRQAEALFDLFPPGNAVPKS